jgi:hypothetical protein
METPAAFSPVPQDEALAMLQRSTLAVANSVIRARRVSRRQADKARTAERRAARVRKAFSRVSPAFASLAALSLSIAPFIGAAK